MWRGMLIAMLLAGCVQLPPSPEDVQAKRFEAVPDKSVIYLVRNNPDFNWRPGVLMFDRSATISTNPGTYFRWEIAPGQHSIGGFAGDSGLIVLQTEPGKLYFVQQTVMGARSPLSVLQLITERDGRAIVARSRLIQ
jgi:hypothetical protein